MIVDSQSRLQPREPRVGVVAPCYNEELGIEEFLRRVAPVVERASGGDYEIVLVDDGSKDRTWTLIQAASSRNSRVVGVRLMRNHGHQLAATAGLMVSRAERVLLIDADLQDPPELLPDMMKLMDDGADVVYGQRVARSGETIFKKVTASYFYRTLSRITSTSIPRDVGDFRLMNRRVVDILNAMPERHRFIRGMVSWIGGNQAALQYQRDARYAGETKYPFHKMVRFAVDAVTSFSIVPLRLAIWLGLGFALVALGMFGYAMLQWARGYVVPGWTSITMALALFSGVQLTVTGIIGEYLGRLVEQSKGRPLVLIDEIRRGPHLEKAVAVNDAVKLASAPGAGL